MAAVPGAAHPTLAQSRVNARLNPAPFAGYTVAQQSNALTVFSQIMDRSPIVLAPTNALQAARNTGIPVVRQVSPADMKVLYGQALGLNRQENESLMVYSGAHTYFSPVGLGGGHGFAPGAAEMYYDGLHPHSQGYCDYAHLHSTRYMQPVMADGGLGRDHAYITYTALNLAAGSTDEIVFYWKGTQCHGQPGSWMQCAGALIVIGMGGLVSKSCNNIIFYMYVFSSRVFIV